MSRSSSISGITSQDTKDVWRFPAALNGEIRTRRCTPFSDFRYPYAFSPLIWNVMDLMPASSPSNESKTTSSYPLLSAHLEYMRNSICAQSHDSVPPAPACNDRIALSPSYSPESSVLIRILSKVVTNSLNISSISGIREASFSSYPISISVSMSSNCVASFS